MQGHAESRTRQPGRDHSYPRGEVPVMNVDVLDSMLLQSECVTCSQPGVCQSFRPLRGRLIAIERNAPQQVVDPSKPLQAKPDGTNRDATTHGRHIDCVWRRMVWTPHAARQNGDAPPAQFPDFSTHIGFDIARI